MGRKATKQKKTNQTLPGMRKDPRISQNGDSSITTPMIASLFKTELRTLFKVFFSTVSDTWTYQF